MRLATRHGTRELMEYVVRHAFLHELSWQSSTVSELDFSQGNLARLNVHMAGVTYLKLNKVLLSLALRRAPPAGLRQLRIWGKPGMVTHLPATAQLKQLQTCAAQVPELSTLWMNSLPDDAAKAIKANVKPAAAQGLELYISKPPKPEWLAEHLLNPLRDWDGREHISPAHAKKAALTYKNMLAVTRSIDSAMEVTAAAAALEAMVTAYVDEFNKIECRTSIIETVEREEIYTVLAELLAQLGGQLGGQGAALVDEAALLDLFDRLREF
ncbi:hypothetical protein [Janthinobacterium sp. LB3P112]|uniref:hypothetical protein n=1 Tax=Janthinobacterium sp. LB3P112 TaxID=3424196 RepID=UPI003F2146B5